MATIETARTRARREVRAAILAAARQHLADDGADGLSFRAVARDLGMPSSGVYRYFDSRDALLTALIIQSYDSLGDAAEAAVERSAGEPPRQRWVAAAAAIRSWAVEHRHEYALLYGTPIPGYAAPTDTVVPGTRVSLALIRIVADAAGDGRLDLAAPVAATPSTVGRSTLDGMTALLLQLDLDGDLPG
jgi:AcrR family transcriptional regulator